MTSSSSSCNEKNKEKEKARVSRTSLILWHAHQNDAAAVKKLLEEDRDLVNARDYDNRTPLHVASLHGWIDVAKCLIDCGADVNAMDRWKNTPLADAEGAKKHGMIELLKSYGGLSFGQTGSHFEPKAVPPPLPNKCDWEIDPFELDFSTSCIIGKVEPATLVPLAHGCRQVFLVGDPVQLPATVISPTAERFGYGTSLFKRFQGAGFPVEMLRTQYRMHPQISIFPCKEFYDGFLENGELVERQTKRDWHAYSCFGPFSFFDIDGVESQPPGSGSWVNEDEVDFIVLMYHKLASQYPELKLGSKLAVVSPYRHQVKLLRDRFRATFGEMSDQVVDINTVDGFQGREKDVAIFSCVRANTGKGIGFVSDFRRMNVGFTRARSSVLVVGSASTLMQDDHWSNLVNSAKDRGCYFKVEKPHSSFFSVSNLESLRVKPKVKMEEKLRQIENDMAQVEASNHVEDDVVDGDGGGFDEE